MSAEAHTERLLPLPAVLDRTAMKRAKLYADVAAGTFPKPVRISANRVAWPESHVSRWIAQKIAEATGVVA